MDSISRKIHTSALFIHSWPAPTSSLSPAIHLHVQLSPQCWQASLRPRFLNASGAAQQHPLQAWPLLCGGRRGSGFHSLCTSLKAEKNALIHRSWRLEQDEQERGEAIVRLGSVPSSGIKEASGVTKLDLACTGVD